MDDPHRVLRTHLVVELTGWRRHLPHRCRCRVCGEVYPCTAHRAALDELTPVRLGYLRLDPRMGR